jgi:hypothetical protein
MTIKISIFLFIFLFNLNAQDFVIKSLQTYSNYGNKSSRQAAFPIINSKDPQQQSISIEFDIQADTEPSLKLVFKFCDKNWQPYDNLFLENPLYNTEYNLYFERLPLNVRGAEYHYKGTFPNDNVTFPFSGKWLYYIVDSNDDDRIYAEGKFIVIIPEIKIKAKIKKDRLENESRLPVLYGRTFSLRVDFTLPDSLYPGRLLDVEVIKNQEIFDPVIITKEIAAAGRYYEWNGDREFSFFARDIKPGKYYRKLDLRDRFKFQAPETNAQYDGIEVSRFQEPNKGSHNFGGSILNDFTDEYSEYLNVKFRLRLPDDFNKDVFIVGSFTDWDVYPSFIMTNKNGLYTASVELKRGVYDYQYVTGYLERKKISSLDWLELEGNDWSTANEYRILVYYDTPDEGGYDKIIGYLKLNSGGL